MKPKTRQLLNQKIRNGIDWAFTKYEHEHGELNMAQHTDRGLRDTIERVIWEHIDRWFDFEDEA